MATVTCYTRLTQAQLSAMAQQVPSATCISDLLYGYIQQSLDATYGKDWELTLKHDVSIEHLLAKRKIPDTDAILIQSYPEQDQIGVRTILSQIRSGSTTWERLVNSSNPKVVQIAESLLEQITTITKEN